LWPPAFAAQPQDQLSREDGWWVEQRAGSMLTADVSTLRVEAPGAVAILAGGEQLVYKLRTRVAAPSEAEARRRLAGIRLRARRLGPVVHLDVETAASSAVLSDLEVRAPRSVRLADVDSVAGALEFRDLHADVRAATGGGPIAADGIGGRLTARTGGGWIRVGYVGGEVSLETGGGEILIHHAGSSLEAFTGAGSIEVRRAGGPVTVRTKGGQIVVGQAAGMVQAESNGGSIEIGAARGVLCTLASGGIRLLGVSGQVRAVTGSGSILAELGGTVADGSLISTGSGDITVLIPSNLAVKVEAVNESPGWTGKIVSEFSEIRIGRYGHPDRRNVASGSLNGGGPLLKVAAAEGRILLRRQK
jgi:hypothetical protein